jgi:sulfonate transport system ATP-binding protein
VRRQRRRSTQRHQLRLQDLLLRVVYRHGVTALLVTHDVDEAQYPADPVLVLDAPPATVRTEVAVTLERPRSRTGVGLAGLRARLLEPLQQTRTSWSA